MLVVNTSQPKRLYTVAETVTAEWQYASINTNADDSSKGHWFDKTNKYVYIMYALTAAPYYAIDRYTYDTSGFLSNKTPITLSGFWTFSSAPTLIPMQWSHSANFYLACNWAGWSASFATLQIYPVTISGTTATLSATLSIPVIASYSINRIFAFGAVVYVFYRNTSTNIIDTGRKYSWSWSSLAGAALPSSVVATVADSTTAFQENYGWASNTQKVPALWGWSSYNHFFNNFEDGVWQYTCLSFNASTDTWSQASYIFNRVFAELNWKIILHLTGNARTVILDTALALNWSFTWHSFWGLSSSRMNWPIIDLANGLWIFRFNNWNFATFWYYSGAAKRIGKVACSTLTGCGIIYSIDGWNWKNWIPTSITDVFDLDYYWETSLNFFVTKTTGLLYVEVTD